MHLLFDLDRTLWDFDANASKALIQLHQHYRIDIPYDQFSHIYHQINDALWESYRAGSISKEYLHIKRFSQTLDYFHITTLSSSEIADYYLDACSQQTALIPGAIEMLDQLCSPRITLSIISNGFREAQIPKMRTSRLLPYFQHIFLSEEIGYQKPDVRFFNAVLHRLQAQPQDCLVIGDDYRVDILGAQAAGIPQVHFNPTQQRPSGPTPTHTITHLSQLTTLLLAQ